MVENKTLKNRIIPVSKTPISHPIKVIGYSYVVADLIHVGHLNHLEACSYLCDTLIVGVLTDKAAREKKKSPTIPFEDRLRMVQALKCVSIAVSQETYSPLPNVLAMQVDILFESTSHDPAEIHNAKMQMDVYGGKIIVLPYYGCCSTTKIKNMIQGKDC